jgi:serine/threonine protein kinase
VETHKKGGGLATGTVVNSTSLGTACGDTALLARLVNHRKLGAGAQGEVWLCRVNNAGESAADADDGQRTKSSSTSYLVAKRMVCQDDADATAKYQQSVRLMNLKHVHLVQYLAVQKLPSVPSPVVTVLMPYYSEGDLSLLVRTARGKFPETYLCSLSLQISTALDFLHQRVPPILHGDIKPENVLLFNNREQVVLMDLDAATEVHGIGVPRSLETKVTLGTTAWMAPEALHSARGSVLSDVWALGAVMFVLAVLPDFPMIHCPSANAPELLNSQAWQAGELENAVGNSIVSRGYSQALAHCVVKMLSHDPRRRPSSRQVLDRLTLIMTNQLVGGNGDD